MTPYLTERQKGRAASRLTLADGVLTWAPAGMNGREVGAVPFSVAVGPERGQASELVWITGDIAIGTRGAPNLAADVLAVCSTDPDAREGRSVVGYIPAVLIHPATGALDLSRSDLDTSEDNARAIADAVGLRFSIYHAPYGGNINREFPGAMRQARLGAAMAYLTSLIFVVFSGVFLDLAVLQGGPEVARVLVSVLALALLAVGLVAWPPVVRRLQRRRHIDRATRPPSPYRGR